MVKPKPLLVTDGARALRAFLKSRDHQSIPTFCAEHGLEQHRISIQRAVKGERSLKLDIAALIEEATHGKVAMEMWATRTGRAVDAPNRRRRRAA